MKKLKLSKIITVMEEYAPPELALFDYVGLLQGEASQSVKKVGLTLDYSLQAINQAIDLDCDLLITHHGPTEISYPLIGNNVAKITKASQHNLAVYRCHLNLDFCPGGIIDTLCQLLDIPAEKQTLRYHGQQLYGGVNFIGNFPLTLRELLDRTKVLGGPYVRLAGQRHDQFSKIAITSGQGFISEFFDQLRPEVYIAGEFEQEATKYAEDMGMMLVELGHHFSEQPVLANLAPRLSQVLKIEVVPIEVADTISVICNLKGEVC